MHGDNQEGPSSLHAHSQGLQKQEDAAYSQVVLCLLGKMSTSLLHGPGPCMPTCTLLNYGDGGL